MVMMLFLFMVVMSHKRHHTKCVGVAMLNCHVYDIDRMILMISVKANDL